MISMTILISWLMKVSVVVNPLSVAMNSSGKKRLILDLSVLNKFL